MARKWDRGSPPPRGSFEWCGVADMSEPAPARVGALFEISFTELDAADRWMDHIFDSLTYARKIHGNQTITDRDIHDWDAFVSRWKAWRYDQNRFLGVHSNELQALHMMSTTQRATFNSLLNESKQLHDRYVSKGMATIPVPYMGELVLLIRQLPRTMTSSQMSGKLSAAVKCGEKLLDQNTAWWQWRKRNESKGLVEAIEQARTLAKVYGATSSPETYQPGDPAFEEFIRRLTRIYVEAAGLYGFNETVRTAKAEAVDTARKQIEHTPSYLLYMLGAAGISYLGLRWLTRDKITVRVPDAHS